MDTYPIDGILFKSAPTNICNLGKALTSFKTLNNLNSLKMATELPPKGKNAAATITKSKIFQPSVKYIQGLLPSAIIFTTISIINIPKIILLRRSSMPACLSENSGYVAIPTRTPAIKIAIVTKFPNHFDSAICLKKFTIVI